MKLGANYLGENRCEFRVWSPLRETVSLKIVSPEERLIPLERDEQGYWNATVENIPPGTRYFYQLEGQFTHPDPASHSQPEGVHGASEVIDQNTFVWQDQNWKTIPLDELIVYELHVGTFTPEGTFEAIIPHLPELLDLGINAIEIMPIGQFPGDRNWGYDGVYLYAPQNSYGGVEGLKRLVNACHQQGVAVILDAVYNHFGPEGNYMAEFGPYFTERYRTAWGFAINYDQAYCQGVRQFVIENALYWLGDFHIDALRLDAADNIFDLGAKHILKELADNVAEFSQQQGRKFYLMAETDLNDAKLIRSKAVGGYGLDVHWCDDFHHAIHTVLTGENMGYYKDYGRCEQLAKSYRESFIYTWDYSPNRQRLHGESAIDCPPYQFLVFSQNHDQVGNRLLGERLTALVSYEALKLAAATVLLSPYIPLLFMGEEYGEPAPFQYFISHSDLELVEAVRKGRKADFEAFHLAGDPPDVQSREIFDQCKLNWNLKQEGKHKILWEFYQNLIRLRRSIPALKLRDRNHQEVQCIEEDKLLIFRRWFEDQQVLCLINFSKNPVSYSPNLIGKTWHKLLDSTDEKWMGLGSNLPETLTDTSELTLVPESFVLYET
ncbi:Malto-oligosyltrehalose trehalohydrolase [Planktothrix tepida]|uniref:Malto-oligosyltrehalose trehalohydrolase n=1 Tax=Planktothrix tepida PCC 9214 TaxID=671072 RepID=A0A1J1LMJ7_9CYAN|nr:malto-oligosyltrehalose trehalohydrolase [Planktothrix tepida]CAD5940198.1 Malto-oligosyltrehalose trehalohydrolase [Planktothrix tepida]CUR33164.1 Malto-oligosyltrehalose trehalohydrolase [Planktothrix tepida PCC 9214]